jgi:hypothetical protein
MYGDGYHNLTWWWWKRRRLAATSIRYHPGSALVPHADGVAAEFSTLLVRILKQTVFQEPEQPL